MSDVPMIKTVMSIDDNELDQLIYKRIMKRSGIVENVITFQFADDALDYLKSDECEQIDVILLDINMPRMNGFEFLEHATIELGEKFSPYVVVMLTTSLAPDDEARAKQFKMVKAHLNKPLSIDDLKTVAALLPK